MRLCSKVPDSSIFPMPQDLEHPENFTVYNLEGATETYYYTLGGFRHGILNAKRIITPLCYTAYHRALHVNGRDKYVVGRKADGQYHPNKLELLELETGMPVMPLFAAWILHGNQLAFRMDFTSEESRWGIFDLEAGKISHIPNIPSEEIGVVLQIEG